MSSNQPSNFLPSAISKLHLSISPKARLTVLGVGVGIALVGIFIRYFRRKNSPVKSSDLPNGSLQVPASSKKGRSQSPAVALQERPSFLSRQKKVSISTNAIAVSSSSTTGFDSNFVPRHSTVSRQDVLIYQGTDNLLEAIRLWERAVSAGDLPVPVENVSTDKDLMAALENILDKAYRLQDEANSILKKFCPDVLETFSTASGYGSPMVHSDFGHSVKRTLSVLSDDSFVSALEDMLPSIVELDVNLREPLHLSSHELVLFQEGLREVNLLNVSYRVLRTEFLKCKSDDEFLAKLFCVRQAFTQLLLDVAKRDWLAFTGRSLLSLLLLKANKDVAGFERAYDEMIEFVKREDNWPMIQEELRGRKVTDFSFYDVVLDFIFMDAFDDLAHPPASVIAVAQNRFLSSSFKESTLSAVVWSVIKAKRTRLMYSDGFIAHFYNISEHVSPTFAWGFLGTDEMLKDLFNYFKSQLCNFLTDMFSFERVRFTNVEELAEDIWQICQTRAQMTEEKLKEDFSNETT